MSEVTTVVSENGYLLTISRRHTEGILRKKSSLVMVDSWIEGIKELPPLAAAAIDELENDRKLVSLDDKARLLPFATAAQLENVDAEAINLLPPFPYQLDIQSHGNLGSAQFRIEYQASEGGVRIPGAFSDGLFTLGEKAFRMAGPLYSITSAIDRLSKETSAEGKVAAFAALRTLLPDGNASANIHAENYLLRIRIAHVTAIGLNPSILDGSVSFDPIPMRKDPTDPVAGAEMAVAPIAAERFANEFRSQAEVNATYALESGHYLYIDPAIRTALRVVKAKQRAPLEERMAFLMSPSRVITDAYRAEGIENNEIPVGDAVFFETSAYSDRITGIGEWIPPQLSYLEGEQNNWLPERFSIVLAGKLVTGKPDDVGNWIGQVKKALAAKEMEVNLGEVAIPTSTPGLLATLQRLQPPEAKPDSTKKQPEESRQQRARHIRVLQTRSNFDQREFKKQFKERKLESSSIPLMKVSLKEHQVTGVAWLTSSFLAGWPGVLLADDMGLGKTLESLTLLMLLRRERIIRKGHPALVVAPTSLLRNWQDEHNKHTFDEGLGKPLVAFGSELRNLKIGRASEDDVVLLDTAQIADSNWVLTTYETVRDYHLSFARIPFSVAVLDEVQKAKNPTTRINATLKALNIDYVIGMTGTPVENSISDLWAVTDIIAPGYFAPLKEFMKTYGKSREVGARQEALKKLSAELLQAVHIEGRSVPPYALRRLKEDVAKDLPAKHEGPMLRAQMPSLQAQRYADVSAAAQSGNIKILRALHDFRSISLHPADPESVVGGHVSGDEYIKMSARLSETFDLLRNVSSKREKAIIFVNNRRMQSVLSRLIEQKFGCSRPEFIRGDTIPGQRQEIVNRFSKLEGFAVLILSPRAAGVGLNIVAANHVIHLDRWWNPAVEDQCTDRAYRIGATKDVYVHRVGAVHPVLSEHSYDVVLDNLLTTRREVSRRIFTSSELSASDFAEALKGGRNTNEFIDLLPIIDRSGYLGLEEFVRDRLIAEGLNANLTRNTGDGGADIVVRDEIGQIIYLVQCKHTTNIDTPIDAGLSEDARRVCNNWQADNAVVVGISNAKRFAPRVVAEFSKINGRLVAREDLVGLRFGLSTPLIA